MGKTLVAELKSVDNVTENAGINKIALYRNILENKAETNSLVRMALNGDVNISDECKAIIKKLYGKGKDFYPHFIRKEDQQVYINKKGQEIKISELEEVVGDFVSCNVGNLGVNPIGGPAVLGLLGYGVERVTPKIIPNTSDEKVESRRRFLKGTAKLCVAIGAAGGLFFSAHAALSRSITKDDAYYAQSIISEVRKAYKQ